MKLLQQVSLFKRDGTRLLIYEIDLCEVGRDEYVVNFRQGQQGRALKDGTKTVMPVDRRAAGRTLDRLVAKLESQGYSTTPPGPARPAPPPETPRVVPAARPATPRPALPSWKTSLLVNLQNPGGDRDLDRDIWRAGIRRLTEATPILLGLLDAPTPYHRRFGRDRDAPARIRRRTVSAALARIADPRSLDTVRQLAESADPAVRRMGEEGLRAILTGADLEAQRAIWRGRLPVSVAQADGRALVRVLDNIAGTNPAAISLLYLLDEPEGRAAILTLLAEVPFSPPTFRIVRDLYKRAEIRDDGEVWGLIAWRMEHTRARGSYGQWDRRQRRYVSWAELVRDPDNTRYAWGGGTKRYFRRRIWRAMDERGRAGQAEGFCALATGYMKRFTEQQAGQYGDRTWALGNVLHRNAAQIWRSPHRLSVSVAGFSISRAEAYPALWDECPDRLVELLCDAQSGAVFTFALRALKQNRAAWPRIPLDRLLALMAMDRHEVVEVAITIALSRFDARDPDHALVGAIANCSIHSARRTAHDWLRANPGRFVDDEALMLGLLRGPHEDTRAVAAELVDRATPTVRDALTRTLFDQVEGEPGKAVEALLGGAVERGLLRSDDLLSLLTRAPDLTARLALADHRRPNDDLVAELLKHEASTVRAHGVTLLGRLPDHVLTQRYAVLVHLCTHPDPAVRGAIRPVIARLASGSPTFADSILASLIEILRQPEASEGAHDDIVKLIQQALPYALSRMDTTQLLRLSQSTSSAVSRLITAPILALSPTVVPLADVVRLADHSSVEIRRKAWQMARAQQTALEAEPDLLLQLVDAEWDDARAFAFAFIQEAFTTLPPTVLVGLTDSVRPDVQRFGQDMIKRLFKREDGGTYLRMLSQHPAPNVQLFVTNLLSGHADRPERLVELEPYFMVVLCSVHRGKAAKARVIHFLRRAAERDATSATIVARIFAHVSASAQVHLHAVAVEALLAIQLRWPTIEVPLRTIEPAFRGARGV